MKHGVPNYRFTLHRLEIYHSNEGIKEIIVCVVWTKMSLNNNYDVLMIKNQKLNTETRFASQELAFIC